MHKIRRRVKTYHLQKKYHPRWRRRHPHIFPSYEYLEHQTNPHNSSESYLRNILSQNISKKIRNQNMWKGVPSHLSGHIQETTLRNSIRISLPSIPTPLTSISSRSKTTSITCNFYKEYFLLLNSQVPINTANSISSTK